MGAFDPLIPLNHRINSVTVGLNRFYAAFTVFWFYFAVSNWFNLQLVIILV